ncbi:hypothetical protein [Massilia frigida]|nr:hypothetical protein [Massilia frigida]
MSGWARLLADAFGVQRSFLVPPAGDLSVIHSGLKDAAVCQR